jgi:hypothetical protein
MSGGNHRPGAAVAAPRVEELESRDLLSVTVLPHKINVKSHGVFTVRVVSDTTTAATVLQSGTPTFTVDGSTTLTPESTRSVDFNHDGTPDLQVKFRRSGLAGLMSGTHTLAVAASAASGTPTAAGTASSTPAETGTFVLSGSSGRGRGNHHGKGPGSNHGRGAGSHHGGSSSTGTASGAGTTSGASQAGTTTGSAASTGSPSGHGVGMKG